MEHAMKRIFVFFGIFLCLVGCDSTQREPLNSEPILYDSPSLQSVQIREKELDQKMKAEQRHIDFLDSLQTNREQKEGLKRAIERFLRSDMGTSETIDTLAVLRGKCDELTERSDQKDFLGIPEEQMNVVVIRALKSDVEQIRQAAEGFDSPKNTELAIRLHKQLWQAREESITDALASGGIRRKNRPYPYRIPKDIDSMTDMENPGERYELFWDTLWMHPFNFSMLYKVRVLAQGIIDNWKYYHHDWKILGLETRSDLDRLVSTVALVEFLSKTIDEYIIIPKDVKKQRIAAQEIINAVQKRKVRWSQIGFRDQAEFEKYVSKKISEMN
jgi:hypothetical protein